MDSKEKVIQQVMTYFLTQGVEGLTIDKIAASTNISTNDLKEQFGSVERLIEEAMELFFKQADHLIQNILDDDINAIQKWLRINDEITKLIQIDDKQSTVYQLRIHYPEMFEKMKGKQWDIVKNCFQSYLFQGMKEGLFHLDIDTDLFMRFYFLGLINIEQTTLFNETAYNYAQIKEKYIELQIRIVATDKGLAELERLLNID